MFCFLRDLGPIFRVELKLLLEHPLKYFLIVVALKWWVPAEHDIQDDSETPHITREVIVTSENLRCHIVGSADYCVHLFARVHLLNMAKAL